MNRDGSNQRRTNDRENWLRQRAERAREREKRRKKKEWTFIAIVAVLALLFIFVPKWRRADNVVRSQPDQAYQEEDPDSPQEIDDAKKGKLSSLFKRKRESKKSENEELGNTSYPYKEIPKIKQGAVYRRLPEDLKVKCDHYPESKSAILKYEQWKANPAPLSMDHVHYIGQFPNSLQWDPMWGFYPYGPSMLAINGCGPTTFSNIYVGLTGDDSFNPYEAAKFCEENGYTSGGTYAALFDEGVMKKGLDSVRINFSKERIDLELEKGRVICILVKPGIFSRSNHYLFIQSVQDGVYTINDPNSAEKSNRGWSYEELSPLVLGTWSIGRAN